MSTAQYDEATRERALQLYEAVAEDGAPNPEPPQDRRHTPYRAGHLAQLDSQGWSY